MPARWSTVRPLPTTVFPVTTPFPSVRPTFNQFEHRHSNGGNSGSGSDLKASSSQDSRRTQNENVFEDEKPTQKTTPKPLVIEFQPPFLHPIHNLNDAPAPTTTTTRAPQFVRPTTTIPNFNRPETVHSTPESRPSTNFISAEERTRLNSIASSGVSNFGDRLQTSTPAITSQPPIESGNLIPVLSGDGKIKEPPTVLLPPYESNQFTAPTQGPPVYREWKLPADSLEPPIDENKSNGAITISDENQIPVIPPQTTQKPFGSGFLDKDLVPPLFESSTLNFKLPSISLQPPAYSPLPVYNDTVQTTNHSFPSFNALHNANTFSHSIDKAQTQRSVSSTPTAINSLSTKRNSETTTRKDLNYLELKKQYSVPEFTFPLENVQRPSYTENNAVNSFQIKIPDEIVQSQELVGEGSSIEVQRKPWYGENAKCPECHPSFLKPNSCEPCIKIR